MNRFSLLLAFFLLTVHCSLLTAPRAQAHTRTASYSEWTPREDGVDVRLGLPWIEFQRIFPQARTLRAAEGAAQPDLTGHMRAYVLERVRASTAGEACKAAETTGRADPDSPQLIFALAFSCPAASPLSLSVNLFFDTAPSHLHFARWRSPKGGGGATPFEKLLTETDREWTPETATPSTAPNPQGFASFLLLGLEHILSGYDHLLFLLALLLLGFRPAGVAGLVTAFTVGHSTSLAAAALGWVRPLGHAAESVIGFSIALVALEALMRRGGAAEKRAGRILMPILAAGAVIVPLAGGGPPPWLLAGALTIFSSAYLGLTEGSASQAHAPIPGCAPPPPPPSPLEGEGVRRTGGGESSVGLEPSRSASPSLAQWIVVFMFGLVHGVGFAGALSQATLDPGRAIAALFGFNLGVEIGQLGAVLGIAFVGLALSNRPILGGALRTSAASVALTLGLFWFWSRLA